MRCSALQCVAVRCSALQCVAVRCSALQFVAVRCCIVPCAYCSAFSVCAPVTTMCCSVLQHVAICCTCCGSCTSDRASHSSCVALHCSALQGVAGCCRASSSSAPPPLDGATSVLACGVRCGDSVRLQVSSAAMRAQSQQTAHCNTLHHTAMPCSTLHSSSCAGGALRRVVKWVICSDASTQSIRSTLHHSALHCNMLHHIATVVCGVCCGDSEW